TRRICCCCRRCSDRAVSLERSAGLSRINSAEEEWARRKSTNNDARIVLETCQALLLLHQTKQRFGVAGREPHAAVRCGSADAACEAMDGFAPIEEDRVGHRRVVVLFRLVVLVEPAHLVMAARRREAARAGGDPPLKAWLAVDGDDHALIALGDGDNDRSGLGNADKLR